MTAPQASLDEDSLALVHFSLSRQGDRIYNEDAYCHARDQEVVSFAAAHPQIVRRWWAAPENQAFWLLLA